MKGGKLSFCWLVKLCFSVLKATLYILLMKRRQEILTHNSNIVLSLILWILDWLPIGSIRYSWNWILSCSDTQFTKSATKPQAALISGGESVKNILDLGDCYKFLFVFYVVWSFLRWFLIFVVISQWMRSNIISIDSKKISQPHPLTNYNKKSKSKNHHEIFWHWNVNYNHVQLIQ